MTIAPGANIELRDAVWRVVRVDQTSTGHAAWHCKGVSEIVRDQDAIFLEALEKEVRVLDPRTTAFVRDTSSYHRAGLLYVESLLRDVPPTDGSLYVGQHAAMDVLEYQLEPVSMALAKPRARILIADAVGLGKTLEAGILLAELARRGRAKRVLVATVRSMLTQFQKEMWCRFSIPLVRLDSVGLQRIRSTIPTHHNPFYYFDRAIISIDTLKQNNAFRTHVEQAHWDVIVIDEAHNVAARGNSRSQRARIAEVLAQNCDHLILLSATPHDGKPRSFASLMTMLEPTAIADPDNYGPDDIRGLFVRRFKKDVASQIGQAFPERHITEEHAAATPEEEAAFAALTDLELLRIDARRGGANMLFKTVLEKALFSSPAACVETIDERVRRTLRRPDHTAFADDVTALGHLRAKVAAVGPGQFAKLRALTELLAQWEWNPKRAKEDRLVVFTERRATLEVLRAWAQEELGLSGDAVEILHGGLADIDQQRIVEDFGKAASPVRLLLASDVASEGLNLHYLCHRLVHFDVPWSLMRFQQRNGRVDRYGQQRRPQIAYLLTDSENPQIRGDMRILELLIEKDRQATANIGDPSAFMNVYDVDEEEALTARAMETGSAEALDAQMGKNALDPFALLLGDAQPDETDTPPVRGRLPSLFRGDFDYLACGLHHLGQSEPLDADIRPRDELIEFACPPDLGDRFKKLPVEVRPKDGKVLLTADRARMMRAMEEKRREEHAWPDHQLLWPLSPVLEWLGDRVRGEFARHTCPTFVLRGKLEPGERALVISGLFPNRRGQPLVHRWYVASFSGDALSPTVQTFTHFLARTSLRGLELPNHEEPVDTDALQARLPLAVDAVSARLAQDRDAWRKTNHPRLQSETDRLDLQRDRQLAFALERHKGDDAATHRRREEAERTVRRRHRGHLDQLLDALTLADTPFLMVIAAFCDAGGAA